MTDDPSPSRRRVLQALGVGVFASQPTLAQPTANLYQPSPPSVTPTTVALREQNHRALGNTWIAHTFGFITENTEPASALTKIRDAATYTFNLDGTEVTDFHRGWESVSEEINGCYSQMWRYVVPPLAPGDHRYSLGIKFDEPVRTQGNPSHVWEGTYRFTGTYTTNKDDQASQNVHSGPSIESTAGSRNKQYTIKDPDNG
jgi:hypothetical protein